MEGRRLVPYLGKRIYLLRQRPGERPTWYPCPPGQGPGLLLVRLQGMSAVLRGPDGRETRTGLGLIRELRPGADAVQGKGGVK